MRGVILLLSLACYVMMTYSQQCRQVLTTVCDNDVIKSNMQKGDKGDAGGFGEKGMQGESCTLGSLGTDIVTRLAKIEELLTPPSTTTRATITVNTTTTSIITSCSTSSSNRPHTLTSGVEVYCEDGWTASERLSTVISGIAYKLC
ncbi:uncharacterized protein LOC143450575 isoform X2 [Clavelina lepadiformis]|uniref:uncharacterized protein LOC143450575 isoform X2 n=1 Tax=Clavelina lepadiformis TaxID=159417 RepID=UPI00404361B3